MARIDGGALVARFLKQEGVTHIFALSGGHVMPIFYGCQDAGIEVVELRHECAAGFAADAYARVTGRPGVLVTTAGPGVTNATTAMAEAMTQGTPLIHIGGAAPARTADTGDEQDIETLAIMESVSRWARRVQQTERIPEYLATAWRHALDSTPGPVYMEIPVDVLRRLVEEDEAPTLVPCASRVQPAGDPGKVEEAAELLCTAERPVMVIGSAARFGADDGRAVAELAEHLQMPVSVQTMCRGLFASEEGNPLFRLSGAEAEADVVLMLSVTNDFLVGKGRPPQYAGDARLIQVNPDPTKIGYNAPAAVSIVGDAVSVARQLLEGVARRSGRRRSGDWVERATELVAAQRAYAIRSMASDEVPMNPGRCAYEVSRFLEAEGRDWTVVLDGGDAAEWMREAAVARRPGQLLMYGPLGTIGIGAGFAIGAWAANGKPILYYTGDGSFGFYPMEFDTFCRYEIPVVCVISNDSAWGMIKHAEGTRRPNQTAGSGVGWQLAHMRAYERLTAIWDGMGAVVGRPDEIGPAIRRAVDSGRPAIINVETDRVHTSPYMVSLGYGGSQT